MAYANSDEYTPPNIALITDVCMPGKSGYELIDEIRKSHPKQKVVVLTGTPHNDSNHKTKACFYLQKPVSTKKLITVIELLSACTRAGNTDLASECKTKSDLDIFGIHDWTCPLQSNS
jgi:FixJ family two-component response regulator